MSETKNGSAMERMHSRRALEALRAGVPNRDVVRLLPPLHQRARMEFEALLRDTEASWQNNKSPRGLLISGGFGMGKSHLL
jgi:predicted ATPase